MTRIIILGNTWHGNWSLSLFEELKKQKKQTLHINVRLPNFITGISFIDTLVKKIFLWKINYCVTHEICNEDIVIVITPNTLTKKTFEILKQKNTQLIAWFGDDPFRKGNTSMYLPFFKKIFVVDASWIQSISTLNPNVEILPHALREDIFFPTHQKQKPYKVSFVGDSFNGSEEGLYRASLLKDLHKSHIEIALFGDKGWITIANSNPEYEFLKSIYQGPISKPGDLNTLYNNSHIVLNIHHRQVKNGANQRIFEASGSEAFQISDKQELVEEIFSDAIESYENSQELVKKIQYYLTHADEAKQKAQKAWALVKQHTYQKRIEKLLELDSK